MYTLNFSVRRYQMMLLIQSRNPSTTFTDSSSPQNKALDWILSDPFSSDGLPEDRLVQRFALATLYYSTDGANYWRNGGGWLTSTNECDWDGDDRQFLCSSESMVEVVFLVNNQLTGPIPSEFALLTQLTYLALYNNDLTGSMPSSLCSAVVNALIFIDCDEIACNTGCCSSGVEQFHPECPLK